MSSESLVIGNKIDSISFSDLCGKFVNGFEMYGSYFYLLLLFKCYVCSYLNERIENDLVRK